MDTIGILVAVLVVAVGGGSLTIGALRFNFPGTLRIKRWVISPDDALKIRSLMSEHMLTVIFQYKLQKEKLASPATLYYANDAARRFYGLAEGEQDMILGKSWKELKNVLRPLIANFDSFEHDQERVQNELNAGHPAFAEVPMVISDDHPHRELHGRSFFPIIAHMSKEEKGGAQQTFITVLYVDTALVPHIAGVDTFAPTAE